MYANTFVSYFFSNFNKILKIAMPVLLFLIVSLYMVT